MSSNPSVFDLAVIGLGAIGSSTLYHLSKSGLKVLGIDQFSPPHEMGSSHGDSRITRLAVGEGSAFVPFVKRSHQLWTEIHKLTGEKIMTTTGGLLLDTVEKGWSKHGAEGFFDRTVRLAQEENIPHEILHGERIRDAFPQFNTGSNVRAYYEPEAGFLRPEMAIKVQLQLAESNKAVIKTHTQVQRIAPLPGGGVSIQTNQGLFEAARVLVSAGAWIKDFIPAYAHGQFKICRQVLHWLPLKNKAVADSKSVFMWGYGNQAEDFLYGFPSLDGKTVKVATESFVESRHADTIDRNVSKAEQEAFLDEKVADKLQHVDKTVLKSKVCIYTVTPDANFVVDHMPDFEEVLVASTCSGHGFKHSAGIGEAIAEKMLEKNPKLSLDPFKWTPIF
jgi:sarcosine oxidase